MEGSYNALDFVAGCFRAVAGQNITKTLPHWESACRGEPRDQPKPGSLSSSTKRPWKRGWLVILVVTEVSSS